MARQLVRNLLSAAEKRIDTKSLSYRSLIGFYFPLALTSILALAIYPLISFFMGKSRLPIESLAVLPVINALTFIFRSAGLSFQEAAIALLNTGDNSYRKLRSFALLLGRRGLAVSGFDFVYPGGHLVVSPYFGINPGTDPPGHIAHSHHELYCRLWKCCWLSSVPCWSRAKTPGR